MKVAFPICVMMVALPCATRNISGYLPPLSHRPPVKTKVKAAKLPSKLPLAGVKIIIDPGHGGRLDHGTEWWDPERKQMVREAEVNYRIAGLLRADLARQGAEVECTVRSQACQPLEKDSEQLLSPHDAKFANGNRVTSGDKGLKTRAALATHHYRLASAEERRRMVFLSLHVDDTGPGGSGAHICTDHFTSKPPEIAWQFAKQFRKANIGLRWRGRPGRLVVQQDLMILIYARNPIRQAVLVEMGSPHFSRPDRERLTTVKGRKALTNLIVTSIRQWRNSDEKASF